MEKGDAISRSALIAEIDKQNKGHHVDSLAHIGMIINDMPAIDVAPVVHAHWVKDYIKIGNCDWKYKCSKCGKHNKQYSPPFCPHCGAMMDEKEDAHASD